MKPYHLLTADGSLIGGRGLCDFVSPDGDLWWLTLEASGTDPVRWKGLGGTGKFAAAFGLISPTLGALATDPGEQCRLARRRPA